MKFSDFFVPKIARSDPNVRIKAVKETEDPGLLQKVLQNDSSEKVRQAASERLKEIQPTA